MNGRILLPLLLLAWAALALPSARSGDERAAARIEPPRGGEPPPPDKPSSIDAPRKAPARESARRLPLPTPPGPHMTAPGADSSAAAPTADVTRSDEAQVEIRVVAAGSDRPVQGAWVELGHTACGADEGRLRLLRTDDAGRLVTRLAPGTLRMVAWSDRSAGGPAFLELAAGARERCVLALEPTHEVVGRVVDAETGFPVADAVVSFWTFAERDQVRTGLDGFFRHDRFPAGELAHQIRVEAGGYGSTVRYLQFEADGSWTLPDPIEDGDTLTGTGVPFVDISLRRALRVTGRVTDDRGRPIEGARVSAEGYFRILPKAASCDETHGETAPSGEFVLTGLRSDIGHSVLVRAPGFAELLLEVPVSPEGEVFLGDVSLLREALLVGVVIDSEGYPVEDIEVALVPIEEGHAERIGAHAFDVPTRIQGVQHSTRTGRAGTFVLESLPERPFLLSVARDREALVQVEVWPTAGGGFGALELRLPPETLILIGELRGSPSAIAGASVEVQRFGWVGRASADERGRFRIAGLDDTAAYELSVTSVSPDTGLPLVARAEAWGFERPILELGEAASPGLARAGRR